MCRKSLKKTIKSILLTTVLISLFVGCQSNNPQNNDGNMTSTQNDDLTSTSGVNINENSSIQNEDGLNVKDISNWNNIDLYAECLGVTIEKIEALAEKEREEETFRLGAILLEYYGDGKQCITDSNNCIYHFSKPVFEKDSYCNAIALLGYEVFPDDGKEEVTRSDLENYFGKQYEYVAPKNGQFGQYIYHYKKMKVVFYENSNSTISKNDNSVLINENKQEIGMSEILSTQGLEIKNTAITSSNIGRYGEINEYFNLMGKSTDEISKVVGTLQNVKADSLDSGKRNLMIDERENEPKEFYVDSKGVYYEFNEGDKTTCLCIWSPFKLLSETFKDKDYITLKEFADYFNDANFVWMSLEEVGYLLTFEDNHDIFIHSYNNEGSSFNIYTNQYVYLN